MKRTKSGVKKTTREAKFLISWRRFTRVVWSSIRVVLELIGAGTVLWWLLF